MRGTDPRYSRIGTQAVAFASEREPMEDKGSADCVGNDVSGVVFQVVHGSFVDGPGIRTTVFLKGCPLRCDWCCNPESQAGYPELKVTQDQCDGCGRCIEVCPSECVQISGGGSPTRIEIDRSACEPGCSLCVAACPTRAIELFGWRTTAGELYEIVRRDKAYYTRSGGGVTIGGGEPTFQARFTYSLMKLCQADGISVAIDTCGHTNSKLGLRILEEADLLLYDIKGLDSKRHIVGTGVTNALILQNFERLTDKGQHIIVRLPLIPGYSDSDADIEAITRFLAGRPSVERVDLMAFHRFGTIKYGQLGRQCPVADTEALLPERTESIKRVLESHGLNCQIGG